MLDLAGERLEQIVEAGQVGGSACRQQSKRPDLRLLALGSGLVASKKIQSWDPVDVWLGSLIVDTWVAVEPLSEKICLAAALLPLDFPSDPGDRLITATAKVLACPLVTSDERIRAANVVETIW